MGLVCAFAKLQTISDIKKLEEWFAHNKGKNVQYSTIHLFNPQYNLDRHIALLVKPKEKKHIGLTHVGTQSTTYYSIDVEVPVTLNSLEGQFRVKEVRHASVFLLDKEPLMSYALLISDKKDTFTPLAYALSVKANTTLYTVSVSFENPDIVSRLSELGNVKWIVVRDIRDTRLRSASFHGDHLESHEIIRVLTRRGRVSGIIIIDRRRRMRITLGRSGRIYTPSSENPVALAGIASEILQRLIELGLVSVKEPFNKGFSKRH